MSHRAKIKGVRGIGSGRPPRFVTPSTLTGFEDALVLFPVTAVGPPAPTLTLTAGSLPAGLSFADAGGGKALIGGVPTTTALVPVTVTATNAAGTTTQQIAIVIGTGTTPPTPVAPTFTSAPSCTTQEDVGMLYPVTADGEPAPTFTVNAGSLPSGVTLTNVSGGAYLSGTPTSPGVSTFTLRATNSQGHDDQVFTLTVTTATSGGVAPVITSPNSLVGTEDQSLLFPVTATGAPVPTLTIAGALPAGLTFADYGSGTALIGGTPTAAAFANPTVTATNTKGTATQSLAIVIGSSVTPPDPHVFMIRTTGSGAVDNTGATNCTAQLQAQIDLVPSGTVTTPNVIRFPAGTYRVDGQIYHGHPADNGNEANKTPIHHYTVFDGSLGATIKRVANPTNANGTPIRDYPIWVANLCTGLVWYGFEFHDDNVVRVPPDPRAGEVPWISSREAQHMLDLSGCWDAEVSNCLMHHTFGDGLTITAGGGRGYSGRSARRIWVHDCETNLIGRQGMSVVGGTRDIVIENNYIHDGTRTAIDIEPNGVGTGELAELFNIHVLGNRIEDNHLSTIGSKGSSKITDLVVVGNYGHTGPKPSFEFGSSSGVRRENIWMQDNDFDSGDMAHAITVRGYDGVDFRNNTIRQQVRLYDQDTRGTPPSLTYDPLWPGSGHREAFVTATDCTAVASVSNTNPPANSIGYYPAWTYSAGTPISTTPPAPPVCGAPYARRSTGGWTP